MKEFFVKKIPATEFYFSIGKGRKTLYSPCKNIKNEVGFTMKNCKRSIMISTIIIILVALGGLFPAASAVFESAASAYAAPPCCPIYADYPDYPYPVDPYYQFPTYCLCPFLNASLARFERWDIPDAYWEYIIQDQDSQCTTCSGTTSTVTFSYSDTPIIIPERDAVIGMHEKLSPSFAIKSKEMIISKYVT
jgi:hypothetical protein